MQLNIVPSFSHPDPVTNHDKCVWYNRTNNFTLAVNHIKPNIP